MKANQSICRLAGSRGTTWNFFRQNKPTVTIQRPILQQRKTPMRKTLNIIGALLVLFGVIWILQGINILPGSFMTGQMKWAAYGAITAAIGIVMLLAARRIPR